MKDYKLELTERVNKGSSSARRYRKEGNTPCVIYSEGKDPLECLMVTKDFVKLAQRSCTSQVFETGMSGKENCRVIVKEIQRNYTTGEVLHVDFQKLADEGEVKVFVPVKITGESVGVKTQGGVLSVTCRKVLLSCPVGNLPGELTVDVSELTIGQRVRTSELELPEGCTLKSNPAETVAVVLMSREAVSEADSESASEGEGEDEGEEAVA